MKNISIPILFLLLITGCGYTVLDIPRAPVEPYELFRVYGDTNDVPFDYVVIQDISTAIPWQSLHLDYEPTEYEKGILLTHLISDALYYDADGLINMRFYSKRPAPYKGRAKYCAVGTAMMIRHISE